MDCSSVNTSDSSSVPGAAKSALSSSTVESAMIALMDQDCNVAASSLCPRCRGSDREFGRRVETRRASARLNCSLTSFN